MDAEPTQTIGKEEATSYFSRAPENLFLILKD